MSVTGFQTCFLLIYLKHNMNSLCSKSTAAMSGTTSSPQRESSVTENPPLNGGGDGDVSPEDSSPTDVPKVRLSAI